MKKLRLLSLVAILSCNVALGETKIYEDYKFNQLLDVKKLDKTDIKNLYRSKESGLGFYVVKNKLKYIKVAKTEFNLESEIANFINHGYTIKRISYRNKFEELKIKNVGELLSQVKSDLERSEFFNVASQAEIKFESILDNKIILIKYTGVIDRSESDCIACNEINEGDTRQIKLLEFFFTSLNKKL